MRFYGHEAGTSFCIESACINTKHTRIYGPKQKGSVSYQRLLRRPVGRSGHKIYVNRHTETPKWGEKRRAISTHLWESVLGQIKSVKWQSSFAH